MPDKTLTYIQLAQDTARQITSNYRSWTSYLSTASRLYKYQYSDQLLIYAQRPDATACAEYDLWNNTMHRYVRRGSKGIALLHNNAGQFSLRYVFDVSDTGTRRTSLDPFLWQINERNESAIAAMLEQEYDVSAVHGLHFQLAEIAQRQASAYWQDHQQDVFRIVDGSFLEEYDEINVRESFRRATSISVCYTLQARCGLDVDSQFEHEDFLNVFDWNTPDAVAVLGTAVSQISGQVLRQIETIAKRVERSVENDRDAVHDEGRLPVSEPDRAEPAQPASEQVRTDEGEVPGGAEADPVSDNAAERDTDQPSAGDQRDDEPSPGADDDGYGEIGEPDGGTESQRPDGLDTADEQPESASRGDPAGGADLQLSFLDGSMAIPTEVEQIHRIEEAERAIFAPFAFSVPQDAIDDILRNGSNTTDHRMILVAEFSKQKSLEDMTAAMRRVYHGGYGIATEHGRVTAWYAEDGMHFATGGTARYTRTAQVLSWTDAAKRIGELLEEGRFATNIEVVAALGHERRRMAEGMVNLYWDTDATAREQGYMPTLAGMCGTTHPACVEAATKALADPDLLPAMLAEYKEFRAASKETPGLMRFRYRFIDELDALVNEYTMPRRDFDSSMPEVPKVAPFITNDEIADAMSHGSSFASGKARIYDYFTQSHTPKEYADFLKKEYGIGGRSPALSSATHSSEDHDGKGLHYKKRDCPEIHLSWPQVVKQIQELIRMDRYLTPAEKAELEAIREMHDEPVVVPDERILEATDLGVSEPVIAAEPVQTLADQTRYQLMEIANQEALFSNGRFDRESLPEGLFCYEIRDDSYGNAARLEPSVVVNHFGSIVTRQPIEFPSEGYIDLIENDDWTFEGSEMTLAEFMQREMPSHELKDDSPVSPAEVAAVTENYRLLDRLRTDCEYFLGVGERNVRHLWAGGVREQIAKMRELYNALPEKPEWLTEEAIDSYAERMAPPYLVVAYHHFENGFDAKLDYQTLAEAEKAAQGYVDGTMEADGFQYDGTAVYDQQERQYLRIYGDFPDDKALQQIAALISLHQEEVPAEPAYRVGDTVYLDDRPFDITEISQSHVQLFDKTLPYPIFRSERLSVFEHLLALDQRNQELLSPQTAEPLPDMAKEAPKAVLPMPVNFRITDDELGHGGQKTKYGYNVEAIRTLKQIEAEGRYATPEEQVILSRYVGWGGIPQAFDERNASWLDEYQELKGLLTPEEYCAAMGSVLNAHYTSPTVIRAIYDAVERMGFTSGNVLEPAMGVGNFFGMLPDNMRDSRLYGVELDSISGRIAKQLYPKADITVAGFETTDRRDFFDLAIGNVPFGNYKVDDLAYNKLGFSIHNYFFAKTLDQVRPGGVVAFVTSRYTMDQQSPEVRKYLAERAELLGAIRLPNDAFRANAGTDVVADIIFLQKRERPMTIEPDWVHLAENEDGFTINQYFIDHSEMVLGEQSSESTQYGRQEFTVIPREGVTLADQLRDAVQHINGTYVPAALPELAEGEEIREAIPADPNVKNYSYTIVDGQVYFRENSIMVRPYLNQTAQERVKGLVGLRDCVHELIAAQLDEAGDSTIQGLQAELNQRYDAFTALYGLINSRGNALAFSDDSSYYLLCSLEVLDDQQQLKRKADMFTKRTIKQQKTIDHVDTAVEALAVSIAERVSVDLPYMAHLTGKPEDELADELTGVIFPLPESVSTDRPLRYVTADEYLSGNVRQKLRDARFAAQIDARFAPNVTALEAAQPQDLDASDIDIRLGATWIDKEIYQKFMYETFRTPFYQQRMFQVNYSPHTAEWFISSKTRVSTNDVAAYSTFGTTFANAYKILEDSLNLRDTRIYDVIRDADGNERRVLNQRETTLAQQKQQAIKDAFRDWIWRDPDRRHRLVQEYNERFNSIRLREYDGSHISFAGMNPEITLREHQRNAVAHILYGGNTLLAHEVGAGKTFEMIAAVMESKRLGLCQKAMFVVPNHLTEQWASEFLRLYPSANILVTTKKDFERRNRQKFCSRIATGDYDAVIIGHSQFERIPVSAERQQRFIEDQIDEITAGIEELSRTRGDQFSIKQLVRTRKQLELRLKKLQAEDRKDDVVTFEQLGVDRLYVDEAHSYKNLFLATKMRNVAGLSTSEAQKSSDMFLKCRYMDELTEGRGVVFATGTPVSNSMTELYTMQRYLQYGTLRRNDMTHFDCWASNFGETVTAIELAPEGTGYRARTRFAKFFNLPELMTMFKEVADIKTADQLHLPTPKAHYETVVVKPSEYQQQMVEALSERAGEVHAGNVDPSEDNMLKITSDGRKLGLDQRLINPMLPDDPDSKVNACVGNVFRIWREGQDKRLTQLVFCDMSTPKAAAGAENPEFSVYDDIRSKLIKMGVPAEEIAYIHDANTEARKKELFAKVRAGQVRVLMGSTAKMGAGMNVQDRLIALHDLDCPWRPGDLEQRAGRIVRQGNQNEEVFIYRYVTESTFDAYLWQTVENKQKFISQIMTSKSPVRSCEDVDEAALSYAEIKALCAGDPRIKEKMDLDVDVARLRLMKADHQSKQFRLEDQVLKNFPRQMEQYRGYIDGFQQDLATLSAHPLPPEAFVGMEIKGKHYADKEAAGEAIISACKDAVKTNSDAEIGHYRGLSVTVSYNLFDNQFEMTLRGAMSHRLVLGSDAKGNLIRMENALSNIPSRMNDAQEQLDTLHQQMAAAKEELGKAFPQEEELQEKSARLTTLNALLNIDKSHSAPEQEEKPSIHDQLKAPGRPGNHQRNTPNKRQEER